MEKLQKKNTFHKQSRWAWWVPNVCFAQSAISYCKLITTDTQKEKTRDRRERERERAVEFKGLGQNCLKYNNTPDAKSLPEEQILSTFFRGRAGSSGSSP
jgi:hypothetical protein